MSKMCALLLFAILTVYNCAAVSVKISGTDKEGHKTAILENRFLKIKLSTFGGRVSSFIYKPSGKDLTWDDGKSSGGACKDQFPPNNYYFRELDYELKVLKQTSKEIVIRLRSIGSNGKWKFVSISKTYKLREGQSRLRCKLDIHNQAEAMGAVCLGYWSHNFLGTRNEKNNIFVPMESGVESFTPSKATNSSFKRNLTRGWTAVIGDSGQGVVCLFEYKKSDLAYSWYCRDFSPVDTLEWRLLPEKIPAGKSLETWFELAAVSGMRKINGAGSVGCGEIIIPENIAPNSQSKVKILLEGFMSKKARVDIFVGGQKNASCNVQLMTGKSSEIHVNINTGIAGTKIISARVYGPGKYLFDMEKILQVGAKKTIVHFVPREKKIIGAKSKESWDIKLSEKIVSPHFKWAKPLEDKAVKALFLMPLHGARDIVELAQRMDVDYTFPTILPQLYDMSWRTAGNAGHGENGLDRLKTCFQEKYGLIVIGSEARAYRKSRVRWDAFPKAVRNDILKQVKNGAGLVYVQPRGLNDKFKKIISALRPVNGKLEKTLNFESAPGFSRTVIKSGYYGKGKIFIIDYPRSGFLAPHPGRGTPQYTVLKYKHRFQEYQFAILAKIMLAATGRKDVITAINADKGILTVSMGNKGGALSVEAFDKFSRSQWKNQSVVNSKKLSMKLPPFLNGDNYIHVKLLNAAGETMDFGFAKVKTQNAFGIKGIKLSKPFYSPGEIIAGKVLLSDKMALGYTIETSIVDNVGREIFSDHGEKFAWSGDHTVVRRHKVVAKLMKDGKIVDECWKYFDIPGTFNVTKRFANMLWTEYHDWPIYSLPWRLDRHVEFGFNLLYTAGANRAYFLKTANTEVSGNWFAYPSVLHSSQSIHKWRKTHDRKYLVRPDCLNDPAVIKKCMGNLEGKIEKVESFASRYLFQLGDEMSISWYYQPWDICISKYCLDKFRKWLKNGYGTLPALNAEWDTNFKNWDEVKPMTRIEILTHTSPAPWTDHRAFTDKTFSNFMEMYQKRIKKKFSKAVVGPTGVGNPPAVYGGNWNFWNMSSMACASMYGTARIPLSFDRKKRLIMRYRGYTSPAAVITLSFWEGLFAGQRGTNNWWGPIFIRPDLAVPEVRKYYSKLLWELRNGIGDLLFNSTKLSNEVAILHSQNSLRSNFIKSMKKDYFKNELSYAMALEDLGIAYRFVSPEEIEKGVLRNFKALILPEITALSQKAALQIEKFVSNGATVIADYELAMQDKHCKRLAVGQLDKVFGIKQTRLGITKAKSLSAKGYTDKDLNIKFVGKYTKLGSGRASVWALTKRMKKVPLIISNNYGKGHAYFLNFRPEYSQIRRSVSSRGFKKLLGNMIGIKREIQVSDSKNISNIMTVKYKNGKNIYLCLLPAPPSGDWGSMMLEDLNSKVFKADLKLAKNVWLYDSRKGKYLGKDNAFKINLVPADGTVLALLPYKVEGINISGPEEVRQSNKATVEFFVKVSSGKPSHHVFLIEVVNPKQKKCLHYRKIIESSNGTGKIDIPFALNDSVGKWTIRIKDTASGVSEQYYINVMSKQ